MKTSANVFFILSLLLLGVACKDTYVYDSPNPPSNLHSYTVSDEEFVLFWDDNSAIEDGFVIERADAQNEYAEVGRVGRDMVEYVDRTPIRTTGFRYRIYAYRGDLKSGYSNEINRSFQLSPPTELQLVTEEPDHITLQWKVVMSYPNLSVKLERGETASGPWTPIATVNSGTRYVDETAAKPGPWYYRVAAATPNNASGFGNAVGAAYGYSVVDKEIPNVLTSSSSRCPAYDAFLVPEKDRFIQLSQGFLDRTNYLHIHSYSMGEPIPNGKIALQVYSSYIDPGFGLKLAPDRTFLMTPIGTSTQLRSVDDGSLIKEIEDFVGFGFISNTELISVVRGNSSGSMRSGRLMVYNFETDESAVITPDISYSSITSSGTLGLYAVYREDTQKISFYRIDSTNPVAVIDAPPGYAGMTFSHDGQTMVLQNEVTNDLHLHIYSTPSFTLSRTVSLVGEDAKRVYLAPNDKMYLTDCGGVVMSFSNAYVVDLASGETEKNLVSGSPLFRYPTPGGKKLFVYSNYIRHLDLGWMKWPNPY